MPTVPITFVLATSFFFDKTTFDQDISFYFFDLGILFTKNLFCTKHFFDNFFSRKFFFVLIFCTQNFFDNNHNQIFDTIETNIVFYKNQCQREKRRRQKTKDRKGEVSKRENIRRENR